MHTLLQLGIRRALTDAREGPADGIGAAGAEAGRDERVERVDISSVQARKHGCGSPWLRCGGAIPSAGKAPVADRQVGGAWHQARQVAGKLGKGWCVGLAEVAHDRVVHGFGDAAMAFRMAFYCRLVVLLGSARHQLEREAGG